MYTIEENDKPLNSTRKETRTPPPIFLSILISFDDILSLMFVTVSIRLLKKKKIFLLLLFRDDRYYFHILDRLLFWV